ncbi:hypothetical protein [Flaviaesturariibacter amylovorans]|uniref:YtxH domain-containing protein n=1 Tax=Flaviaesturariibacter amylovorans TaxID=1084520 RepID=A0ABP8GAN7_9BACT
MLRALTSKPLILAGLAAAGYYAYQRMTPMQRQSLVQKGKKLVSGLPLDKLTGALGKAGL